MALALAMSGCNIVVQPKTEDSKPVDETSDWKTFSDSELGFSFKYQRDQEVKTEKELEGIDEGKKMEFKVGSFSMIFTSSDFALGAGEGCCFYISGESIDLNSDPETWGLGKVYDIEKIRVGGRETMRFVRVSTYVADWLVPTVVMPFAKGDYANLMISGPVIKQFEPGIEASDEQIEEFIAAGIYDNGIGEELEEFEKILESLEFN